VNEQAEPGSQAYACELKKVARMATAIAAMHGEAAAAGLREHHDRMRQLHQAAGGRDTEHEAGGEDQVEHHGAAAQQDSGASSPEEHGEDAENKKAIKSTSKPCEATPFQAKPSKREVESKTLRNKYINQFTSSHPHHVVGTSRDIGS